MAINLEAKLSLIDKFSDPMRKVERQAKRTQRVLDAMARETKEADQAMKRAESSSRLFISSLGKMGVGAVKRLGSLQAAFVGVAGAIAGATAAKKIFDATVGEAAKYQQSAITIDAMFDDKKLGKEYREMIEKIAIDSPILDVQEIMSSSRGFIAITKDLEQLERMIKLTELLAAYSPDAGTDGASFALRELMGGDYVSMKERFNMTSRDLKPVAEFFKDGQMLKGMEAFEKLLDRKNITQSIVTEQGGSLSGMWQQVRESFSKEMRKMGEPSLDLLTNFLTKVRDKIQGGGLAQFSEVGANIIKEILTGLTSGAERLYGWFQTIANDPAFQAQSTLYGKVKFVIEDIYQRFLTWLDEGGRDKITQTVSDLIGILAAAIDASIPVLTPIAVKLGSAIGQGIVDGVKSSVNDSFFLSSIGSVTDQVNFAKGKAIKWGMDKAMQLLGKSTSHAGGLSRVPYNGYQATLHKDEQVLTPEEAKEYRNGGGGRGGVTISGNTFNVREEADIEKVAYKLAQLIEREGGQMVNV
jgi:hypothetical protein